jgi:hypothetical protein
VYGARSGLTQKKYIHIGKYGLIAKMVNPKLQKSPTTGS